MPNAHMPVVVVVACCRMRDRREVYEIIFYFLIKFTFKLQHYSTRNIRLLKYVVTLTNRCPLRM